MNYICYVCDNDRGDEIENKLSYRSHFSDIIRSNNTIHSKGIAFISLDGESISYISIYSKGGRVATALNRITFRKPTCINSPLTFQSIEEGIPGHLQSHFRNQTSYGINLFSPKVLKAVKELIKKEFPEVEKIIVRIEKVLQGAELCYQERSVQIIAHEKDSVSLALRIAGFTDEDLPAWSQQNDTTPFLAGYENAIIREDFMSMHDSQVFGEWAKISQYVVGAAKFEKEGHLLTIMNVNRHRIEECLGVDLLMYHHTYKAYVLIQYKRMIRESDSLLCYRPIDASYATEISKMRKLQEDVNPSNNTNLNNYRLNGEFCYFKLCPAEIQEPMSTKMITGMYLPLSYWDMLLSDDSTKGERGGRLVSYNNAQRYLNNTLFIQLFQDGWIGSQIEDTEMITKLIQEALDGKNSVVLANARKTNENE